MRLFIVGLILILCTSAALFAQPGGGGPGGGGDPDIPITGIEWLIAGGALLGIKRLVKKQK